MTKFVLVPEGYDGNITCFYDDKGYLMEFSIGSWNINRADHEYMLGNVSNLISDVLLTKFAAHEGWKWRKARIDLSFDRFWKMYGNARNRIQAEQLYNKMNEKQRYCVLVNLKSYLRYCNRNPKYTQMYPDTYLRAHTTDNWDRVPDWTGTK